MSIAKKIVWSLAIFTIGGGAVAVFREENGYGQAFGTGLIALSLLFLWGKESPKQERSKSDPADSTSKHASENQSVSVSAKEFATRQKSDASEVIKQLKDGKIRGFQKGAIWYVDDQELLAQLGPSTAQPVTDQEQDHEQTSAHVDSKSTQTFPPIDTHDDSIGEPGDRSAYPLQGCQDRRTNAEHCITERGKVDGEARSVNARLKELEAENLRLKKMYAEERLQSDLLKEVIKRNGLTFPQAK